MQSIFRCIWICSIIVAVLYGGTPAAQSQTPDRRPPQDQIISPASDSARLAAIADEVWQRTLERSIGLRLRYGLPIHRLPSVSAADVEKEAAFAREVLEQLQGMKEARLNAEGRNLLAVLRWRLQGTVDGARFHWLRFPVTPYASVLPGVHRVFTSHRFRNADDLDAYLDLLAQYPRLIEEAAGHLRRQVGRGVVMSRHELAVVVPFIQGFRRDPAQSLFTVDPNRLGSIDGAAATRFQDQVHFEIAEHVNPALDRLGQYLAGAYTVQASDQVGLSQYIGGEDYYRHRVARSLTLEMDAEEVHRIGLKEVARLNAEMDSIRLALGYTGDKAAFHQLLRSDARFVPKSPEDIRQRMLGYVGRLAPQLDKAFATLPAARYDVRRLDPALKGGMTFGFYRGPTASDSTGVYFFNGSNLGDKSQVWYEGLAYQELLPGHHFQGALVREQLKHLHPLRQHYSSTVYGEGWAEYAADLARELGGYADPYDWYGRRAMELFAAVRLVLDTGMNLFGWSRERAIQYMRENSLMSEAELASETLRYCCDIPAQALGYRMGMIKIREWRRRAERELGPRFDLRAFHQVILGSGPLPFTVLQRRVDEYIAAKARTSP